MWYPVLDLSGRQFMLLLSSSNPFQSRDFLCVSACVYVTDSVGGSYRESEGHWKLPPSLFHWWISLLEESSGWYKETLYVCTFCVGWINDVSMCFYSCCSLLCLVFALGFMGGKISINTAFSAINSTMCCLACVSTSFCHYHAKIIILVLTFCSHPLQCYELKWCGTVATSSALCLSRWEEVSIPCALILLIINGIDWSTNLLAAIIVDLAATFYLVKKQTNPCMPFPTSRLCSMHTSQLPPNNSLFYTYIWYNAVLADLLPWFTNNIDWRSLQYCWRNEPFLLSYYAARYYTVINQF